jgi:hypothetical protein
MPRVEPSEVAAALGAEPAAERLEDVLAPVTLLAVRQELVKRLRSSGGRPGLAGTSRRAKIPLGDDDWSELEAVAAAIAEPGFAPSAGQVASALLKLSVRSVAPRVAKSKALSRELAAAAAGPSRGKR